MPKSFQQLKLHSLGTPFPFLGIATQGISRQGFSYTSSSMFARLLHGYKILNLLTSRVSGERLVEESLTFPASSLAVSFLTALRSGT